MAYICEYFDIRELVSPKFHAKHGDNSWWWLDPRLCMMLDRIHARFGVTYVNTWHWNGRFDQRGLRSQIDLAALKREGIYLPDGFHETGRAADMHFRDVSVAEARKYILAHPLEFPEIRGVEIAPSWLHVDVRNSDKVIVFNA